MTKLYRILVLMIWLMVLPAVISAQCTPGDETTCPDPENNGQICPDTLPDATVNVFYSQEFTILAPPEYEVGGFTVNIHHLRLVDLGNLPEGLTWESNATDSVFMVGTYYCVLMEGTPTTEGNYPLKITVEVFIDFNGTPLSAGEVTDSTSLSIHVVGSNGVEDIANRYNTKLMCSPNPFINKAELIVSGAEQGSATLEICTIMGRTVRTREVMLQAGENRIKLIADDLKPGIYFVSLRSKAGTITQRIIRSN